MLRAVYFAERIYNLTGDVRAMRTTPAINAHDGLARTARNCFPIRYRRVPTALFSIARYAPRVSTAIPRQIQQAAMRAGVFVHFSD
jgi:hypothetical protein